MGSCTIELEALEKTVTNEKLLVIKMCKDSHDP